MSMIHLHEHDAPTKSETDHFVELGLRIDSYGKPINPAQAHVLGTYGLRLGKGSFYHWGPNHTVDPVVVGEENGIAKVLTIVRGDNGHLALPGGFIDQGEHPLDAAIREAYEETRIDISGDPHEIVYEGGVNDPRDTLHAWAHTTAILFQHDNCPPVTAGDDARPGSAMWRSLAELADYELHGAHFMIIAKAMQRYDELVKRTTR